MPWIGREGQKRPGPLKKSSGANSLLASSESGKWRHGWLGSTCLPFVQADGAGGFAEKLSAMHENNP
jgi:hypothetical protein